MAAPQLWQTERPRETEPPAATPPPRHLASPRDRADQSCILAPPVSVRAPLASLGRAPSRSADAGPTRPAGEAAGNLRVGASGGGEALRPDPGAQGRGRGGGWNVASSGVMPPPRLARHPQTEGAAAACLSPLAVRPPMLTTGLHRDSGSPKRDVCTHGRPGPRILSESELTASPPGRSGCIGSEHGG